MLADALPSWNDGPAKQAIVQFVDDVTREEGPRYVPPEGRIAVVDNDGTLWCEHPVYVQVAFAIARAAALVRAKPALARRQPWKAIVDRDMTSLAATGEKGIFELVAATHAGMTTTEFDDAAAEWLATARHPRFGRLYTELVYQPMLELLHLLDARGFKTFIVSGGGVDFMRLFARAAYGVPPERVVGSTGGLQLETRDGQPELIRLAKIDLIDDGPGKPVGIHKTVGQRPILAIGNSDGDLQMLQYTDAGRGTRLALLLRHDDGAREYAYDRDTKVGKLDQALVQAARRGWTVVSMKKDFRTVFPPSRAP